MLTVFADTVATTGETAATGSPLDMLISFLPMIILVVVFYFILIRPQKKQEKANREMLAALKVGDKVTTIGGIVGVIAKIKDDRVTVETGMGDQKTMLKMERWAIRSVEKSISE